MLRILSSLIIETLPEDGKFILRMPLRFSHPLIGNGKVPIGFVTDFASIPTFFRRIFNVNGKHREEAVVHDFLYSVQGKIGENQLSRKQCDQIFLDGLKNDGISFFKRHAMYQAVRLFGGLHLKITSGKNW